MYSKQCVICGLSFEARIFHQITCSVECRKKHQKQIHSVWYDKNNDSINKYTNNCLTCGIDISGRIGQAKYCSIKCQKKAAYYNRLWFDKECLCCGEPFKTQQKETFLCSHGCVNTYTKKHDDIIKVCKLCDKEFVVEYINRSRLFCTKNCSTKYTMDNMGIQEKEDWRKKISETQKRQLENGERIHSWVGKRHTEESKQKISNTCISRGINSGSNNSMFGKHHSIESRNSMSVTRSQKILDGNYASWFDKGKYFSTKMNEELSYRSSWELQVMELLDRNENVVSFLPEPFRIPYLFEGLQKHYIPDVLIQHSDGSQKLIEIKPSCYLDYPLNLAKFAAAREYCESRNMTFEVWTEIDITALINQERISL